MRHWLNQNRDDQLVQLAPEVLSALPADGYTFFTLLCHNGTVESRYADRPILSVIDPALFVAAWLAAPRTEWEYVRRMFDERYKGGRLQTKAALEKELPWVLQVQTLVKAEIGKLAGIPRLRLERAAAPLLAITPPPALSVPVTPPAGAATVVAKKTAPKGGASKSRGGEKPHTAP